VFGLSFLLLFGVVGFVGVFVVLGVVVLGLGVFGEGMFIGDIV